MIRTSVRISGLAGALLLSLAACSTGSGSTGSSAGDSSSSPSPSVETNGSGDEASPSSGDNVDNVSISWNFPSSIDGFTIEKYDEDGEFLANKANGCRVFTSQERVAGATESERRHSQEYRAATRKTMENGDITNLNYEDSSDNPVTSQDGAKVEGLAAKATYTGDDGVKYKGWFWHRHFDTDPLPVSLSAFFVCPEGEYSKDELNKLFSEYLHVQGISAGDEKIDG